MFVIVEDNFKTLTTLFFQVMSKSITLRPEQIDELAEGIRNSVATLTDIEQILRETEGDLSQAKSLKERADIAA